MAKMNRPTAPPARPFASVVASQPVIFVDAGKILPTVVPNDPTPPGTNRRYDGTWHADITSTQPGNK